MIRVTELRIRGGSSAPNAEARSIKATLACHTREIKLCLGDSAGTLEQDGILGVAGDFAREFVQQFRQCRG
jgi:hypothetical protein